MPELKRGALGKGEAVAPVELLPSVARRVRDSKKLATEILAVEVGGCSVWLSLCWQKGQNGGKWAAPE